MTKPNAQTTEAFVNKFWDEEITPTLVEYIKIPNKSPQFDANWEANGHMEKALQLTVDWLEKHPIPGAELTVSRIEGRTPALLLEVPGDIDETIVMYGHLDKQPEMTGWREDLGPWKPVMEDGKLYGRGGADDGYAIFASVCAIKALKEQNVPHARVVMLIEFSEESGSKDLPAHVDKLTDKIGNPVLVVCLDSGAGNYEQLWSTTSLRGIVNGTLRVDVLTEGVHSGDASGVVPSSFRVIRQLLARLENIENGEIYPDSLKVEIPAQRLEQAQRVADSIGDEVYTVFPWKDDMQPAAKDRVELILNRTWRAALSVTGQQGLPDCADAGNVLRPYTTLTLSLRLPPTLDSVPAQKAVIERLTKNPPYGAKVTVDFRDPATGWNAPELAPWLNEALDEASETFFNKPTLHMGEGGSIPFMGMLGEKFPEAQFVVTGVLGPNSNAHGPNEFLHIPYAKKLTACVAHIVAKHAEVKG